MRQPLFNMEMPAETRDALERVRVAKGHRSFGQTVRALIEMHDPRGERPREPPTSSLQTQFDMTIEENRNQARHELDRIVSDYDGLRWAKRWGGPLIEAGYRDSDDDLAEDLADAETARDNALEKAAVMEKAIDSACDALTNIAAFNSNIPDIIIPNIIDALEKAIQS